MRLNNFKRIIKKEFKENYNEEEIKLIEKSKVIKRPILISILGVFIVFVVALIAVIPITNNKKTNKVTHDSYEDYLSKEYFELKPISEKEYNNLKKNEVTNIPAYSTDVMPDIDYGNTIPKETIPDTSYETNNQVSGVMEGDIAKFDGTYFYYLNVDSKNYKVDLSIFNLSGNRLIYSENIFDGLFSNEVKLQIYDNKIVAYERYALVIYEFDGESIKEEYFMKSRILDTRLVQESLYIAHESNLTKDDTYNPNTYYLKCSGSRYKAELTKYNLKTKEVKDIWVIGDIFNSIYMDNGNIVVSMMFLYSKNEYIFSNLGRYSFNFIFNPDLDLMGVYVTKGVVLNQYSIDIYNNQLRLVTTDNENINRLTIFDLKNKCQISCLENGIGEEGEKVKSVSFKDNICYIVTYKTTDPLYSIDLSNPKEPVITSDLHVDGFSSYLKTFTVDGTEYIFGAGEINNNYKYSVYKHDLENVQIGSDYIVSKYEEHWIWDYEEQKCVLSSIEDGAKSSFINPHAMFFYQKQNILYVGSPMNERKYVLYKIDINDLDNVVSEYKDYETKNESRLFLVDGIIYIPEVDRLIVDSFE